MFRVRFADGGELQLTEAGSKKRAGVWLLRPDAVQAELAHLGPEADELSTEDVARILASDSRRLHSLLRDQRLIAGHRARVGERDPLVGAALALPALDAGRRRADRATGDGDPRRARARARAAARRRERRQDLPRPQQARRAVRALRHPARARRLRGAHDLLLPAPARPAAARSRTGGCRGCSSEGRCCCCSCSWPLRSQAAVRPSRALRRAPTRPSSTGRLSTPAQREQRRRLGMRSQRATGPSPPVRAPTR